MVGSNEIRAMVTEIVSVNFVLEVPLVVKNELVLLKLLASSSVNPYDSSILRLDPLVTLSDRVERHLL